MTCPICSGKEPSEDAALVEARMMSPAEALAKAEHNAWVRWTPCIHKADKWWSKLSDGQRAKLIRKTKERLLAELHRGGFAIAARDHATTEKERES